MKRATLSTVWNAALAIIAVSLLLVAGAGATTTEKVIYNFSSLTGTFPLHGLAFDAAGNLYGTTTTGGTKDCGTVYQLTPGTNGTWTQKLLVNFTCGNDGGQPQGPITVDALGNLYGTTWIGGVKGHGTVFRLAPQSDGTWKYKVLHNFTIAGVDGGAPAGAIVFDSTGALYGATFSGGKYGYGTVYQMTVDTTDKWTLQTLHSFNQNQKDGYNPLSGPSLDSAGNIYGATKQGGANGAGVVYKLSKNTQGAWVETLVHVFNPANGVDGSYPVGSLLIGSDGALYGTTSSGGAAGFYGIVFKFALDSNNKWQETILHSFTNGTDGGEPLAGLIADASGAFYGTASTGGGNGDGLVFKLALNAQGKWAETVLYNFKGGNDGSRPESSLVTDATGALYGTTEEGGVSDLGTVFQVTP